MTDDLVSNTSTEDPRGYKPGGLHPVHLGDKFSDGRYTVIRKLGHGASSTIWLVSDAKTSSYASLKIVSAKKSEAATELAVRKHLEATYDLEEEGSHCGRRTPRISRGRKPREWHVSRGCFTRFCHEFHGPACEFHRVVS
ncbi:Protein kinase [Mycena kentingensis (nom. inval.)]|nr:Protein kinase [Mycena kentingensis (nom. inval.)]